MNVKHIKSEAILWRTSPDKGLKQDFANENCKMKALVDISAGLGSYLGSLLDQRICVMEGLEAITSRSRGDLGKSPSRGVRRSKRTSESSIGSVISGKRQLNRQSESP